MKNLVMIILLFNIVSGQDTLSFTDKKSVRDPAPITPKVLDKIFGISEISILDSIKNSRLKTISGFRLQIFESSSVEEANRLLYKNRKVLIEMTLTSPNCPVAESLPNSVKDNIMEIEEVTDVELKLVWDPPWTKDKMSEAAKLELNL